MSKATKQLRSKWLLPGFLCLLIAGCSGYQVTVQGINLDELPGDSPDEGPAKTSAKEAAHHNDLGVILEKDGDFERALQQYKIAQQKDPRLIEAFINAGNVSVKLNNLAGAEYYYRRVLRREPDHPRALNNLAWVYLLQKRKISSAITLLGKAIAADPDHRYLYLDSLGWAYYLDDRAAEAISVLKSALEETSPEDKYLLGEANYHLGVIYRSQGKREKAADHLKKCLELNPSPKRELEISSLLNKK